MKHLLPIILLLISFLPAMADSLKDTLSNFDTTQNYFTVEKRIANARVLKVGKYYMDVQISYSEDMLNKMGQEESSQLYEILAWFFQRGNCMSEFTVENPKIFFKQSFDLSQTEYDKVNKVLADTIQRSHTVPHYRYSRQFYAFEHQNEKYVLVTLIDDIVSAFYFFRTIIEGWGPYYAVIRLSDYKILDLSGYYVY